MTSTTPPLEGSLAQHSVQTLLEAYEKSKASGRLTVRTAVGEALVKVQDGSVTEAKYGPVDGDNALLRLMSLTEGAYTFEQVQPSITGMAPSSMQELARRAAQRRVDMAHYAEQLGGMNQRYALDVAALNALDHDLRRDLGNVLSLVDGRRTVQELVAVTDIDDVTVLRVLKKLRAMRVIKTDAELEAERKAKEAPPPPPKPLSLEEQLLAQASAREEERQSVIELAVPEALRSTPPATVDNRPARAAAAEAFAASVTTPPPVAPVVPAPQAQAAPAEPAAPPPPAPAPAAPAAPAVAPASPAAAAAPPPAEPRRATPPAGMPVHATPVHLPRQGIHADSARPGKPPRDEIRLPAARTGERAEPTLQRWTDRPTRPEEEDGLEYALDRRASPLGTAAPGGPASNAPHPTPVLNTRVDFPDIGERVTPVVPLPSVGAPPVTLGLGLPPAQAASAPAPRTAQAANVASSAPVTPAVTSNPVLAAPAHDDHDEAFFARAADTSELQALAEQDAASAREAQSQRLMVYVGLAVGAVAVVLLTVIWSAGGDVDETPPAVAAPEAPAPARPATPNVVIPDMGAQVRTGTEAARELVAAQEDPPSTAVSTGPEKSPAVLAAELAAQNASAAAAAPTPAPASQAAAPTPEKPVAEKPAPVPEKPVAEKPAPAPEKPVAEKPTPAPEKPAPAPEDPKRLFADRFDRGKRMLDQGRYEEAKKAFESALKFDPGSARAYTQLGRANYELGNMDEALRLLRKAEALEPAHAYTYLVMGLVQQERGDLANAERAYEKYLTLDTASANARAVQGFLKGLRAQRAAKKGG